MVVRISQNLKQRLLFSLIGIILILFLTYFSMQPVAQIIFTAFLATVMSFALWEYYQIAITKGHHPLVKTGIATTIAYIAAAYISLLYPDASLLMWICLAIGFLMSFLYFFAKDGNPLVNLAITTFGIAYLTIPLSGILFINYFFDIKDSDQDGRWWLIYLLTVTKMTDAGAYVIGKLFGKTKLAEQISPKKTIEGALGGLAVAIGTSFCFFIVFQFLAPDSNYLTLWQSLYLGGLVGIFAQIGDLGESLLKRDAGVKDSNHLPGLGGMLDIVDSLIFTMPVVYLFLVFQQG